MANGLLSPNPLALQAGFQLPDVSLAQPNPAFAVDPFDIGEEDLELQRQAALIGTQAFASPLSPPEEIQLGQVQQAPAFNPEVVAPAGQPAAADAAGMTPQQRMLLARILPQAGAGIGGALDRIFGLGGAPSRRI